MANVPEKPDKRIAVVGAGPGGLTAAMILAHRGFQVDVFEKNPYVGGRNSSLQLGAYRFDVGPTFLMMRYILDEAFEEAGSSSEEHMKFINLDPMYRLSFQQFSLNMSSDIEKTKAEVKRVFPGHEDAVDKFMKKESKRFAYMAPCLQQPYNTIWSLFSSNLLKALPHLSVGKTLFQILRGYYEVQDLALSFSFQSKYLGMSPWECPGAFAILPYIEYAFGIYHTMGGLSEISRTMAEVARTNGARIHLETPVQSLVVENRIAKGVKLDNGESMHFDDVIIGADFGYAAENLFPPEVLKKYSIDKLKKKRLSCSTFMLYLGLDTIYDLPHHTIFMAKDYRGNVNDVFHGQRLSKDISFYVRNASKTDPTLAPEGHSTMYVLVPVANLRSPIDWSKEREPFRAHVLETIEERYGITELEHHIKEEKIITPVDWRDDYNVYEGATFNLAHNLGQLLYLRPHNKFEEVDHCYLTGGGTHPGSGVPTIIESGRIAANMISKHYGIPFTSKNPFA